MCSVLSTVGQWWRIQGLALNCLNQAGIFEFTWHFEHLIHLLFLLPWVGAVEVAVASCGGQVGHVFQTHGGVLRAKWDPLLVP